jgi:hypothetical protein
MAKPVILNFNGEPASFTPTKVDRTKIYGARKRIAIDAEGASCSKAALTIDGALTIRSGMLAQGYFTTEGRMVQRSEMVGLDAAGNTVESKPSTLGVPQEIAGPVEPAEILDLQIQSVYFLTPDDVPAKLSDELKAGKIYKFPFNYMAGLETETAYLLSTDEGTFALTGKPQNTVWVDESTSFVPEAADTEEESDDLDFDSL